MFQNFEFENFFLLMKFRYLKNNEKKFVDFQNIKKMFVFTSKVLRRKQKKVRPKNDDLKFSG